MKTIYLLRAAPTAGEAPEPVTLIINGDIEHAIPKAKGSEYLKNAEHVYCEQAELLASTLESVLCGGVLDRLVGRLMAKRACLFAIPLYRDVVQEFPFSVSPVMMNPLADFLSECTEPTDVAEGTLLHTLYQEYQLWAAGEGCLPARYILKMEPFRQALSRAGYEFLIDENETVVRGLRMQATQRQVR